ncbi:3773_t:CDS:2 [Entrophospora sp. SA101]|nr:3773_t:CDS:2 [Entrophospora sp. SA101]
MLRTGAFRRLKEEEGFETNGWVHLVCALWMPGMLIENPQKLTEVKIDSVNELNWKKSFSSQFYPMVYPIYQPPVNPSYPQNNHPINFSLLSPTKPINSQPRDIPSINDLLEKLDQKYRDDLFTQFLDSFINESIDVLDILT